MDSLNFQTFLASLLPSPCFVLDKAIPHHKYISIDLSVQNKALESFDINSSNAWEQYINKYCDQNQAEVAYGGYLEKRNIYKRSNYFNSMNQALERNIHLGMDFWSPSGTVIYTPLDAEVHSFANNTNFGDYGPTIILLHRHHDFYFYTLYGHLSLESIAHLKIGQYLKAGTPFAQLGSSEVNGDYAPHLHFQIIKNIGDYKGDYPGVCSQSQLEFYRNNCPDPNLLLKLY